MSRSRTREGARGMLAASVKVGALAVIGVGLLGLAVILRRPGVTEEESFEECIRRARNLTTARAYDEAMNYLRLTIDQSTNAAHRAVAGFEMGKTLILLAKENETESLAIEARQYLEAALDLEEDRDERLAIYQALMETARLMNNHGRLRAYAKQALELATDEDLRAELSLLQLDYGLQVGTWQETKQMLSESESYARLPEWEESFAWREALAWENALRNAKWLQECLAEYPDKDLAGVRSMLIEYAIQLYKKMSDTWGGPVREECLFRIARLQYDAGRYDEAKESIQEYLANEPSENIDETLLLLTRLARSEGDASDAERMMTAFVKRYNVDANAAKEIEAVVDMLEESDRPHEALELTKRYLDRAAEAQKPPFLLRAARLASRIGDHDMAAIYFERFLDHRPEPEILGDVLLALADIFLEKQDYLGAELHLKKHMDRLEASVRAKALYRLFTIKENSGGEDMELLTIGSEAVETLPEHEMAAPTLMKIAQRLEKNEMFELAESYWNRVALLRYVTSLTGMQNTDNTLLDQAALGKARCLLRAGERIKADHMFREICRNTKPGAVRAEAAYWWATIATRAGQREEAVRRLSLVGHQGITPELNAHIKVEEWILDILAGAQGVEVLDVLPEALVHMTQEEGREASVRLCDAFFDRFESSDDVDGMVSLLEQLGCSPYASDLPLKKYAARVAANVLRIKGVQAFLQRMREYSESNEPECGLLGPADLRDFAGYLQNVKDSIKTYL